MNTFCDTSWCVLFNLCDRPVFIDVLHLGQHQLESLSVSTHFISAGESLVQYFTAVDPVLGDKDSLARWLLSLLVKGPNESTDFAFNDRIFSRIQNVTGRNIVYLWETRGL